MLKYNAGFTLLELMICLAIVMILASFAYPQYRHHIQRAYRQQACLDLIRIANALHRYYSLHQHYQGVNFTQLGIKKSRLNVHYHFTMQLDKATFLVSAIPQFAQRKDRCGTLSLNQANIKKSSQGESCWLLNG